MSENTKLLISLKDSYFCFDTNTMRIYKLNCTKENLKVAISKVPESKSVYKLFDTSTEQCNCLTLILTNSCNLKCSYCYYKYDPKREIINAEMDTLFNAFIHVDKRFPQGIKTIQYFGGEPLIRFDIIKKLTEKIIEYCIKNQRNIPDFGMNTNGILINKQMMDYFYEHKFTITISIDGKEENNIFRRKINGKPVYHDLVNTIKHIKKLYPDFPLTAEMTFTANNVKEFAKSRIHDIEILHDLGFSGVHMAPVITNNEQLNLFGNECNKHDLFDYISYAYDYSINTFNTSEPIVTTDYQMITNMLKKKTVMNCYCSAGIEKFAVNYDGKLYPCHMNIDNNQLCVYNDLDRIRNLNYDRRSKNNNHLCSSCWNKNLCNRCEYMAQTVGFCDFQKFKTNYLIRKIIGMIYFSEGGENDK